MEVGNKSCQTPDAPGCMEAKLARSWAEILATCIKYHIIGHDNTSQSAKLLSALLDAFECCSDECLLFEAAAYIINLNPPKIKL